MATEKPDAACLAAGVVPTAAERFSRTNRRRLSAPGLRTFLTIGDRWNLTDDERMLILGSSKRSTYVKWVTSVRDGKDITLNVDTLMRISIILGIHEALAVLHSNELDGLAWLRTPNDAPLFGGSMPMALIANGTQDGPMRVRRFLDAARGGLYMTPNEIDIAFHQYSDADVVLE